MQLTEAKYRIKCEMGACKNTATHTIKLSRVGVRSQIHVCKDCLLELAGLVDSTIMSESSDTVKAKKTSKKATDDKEVSVTDVEVLSES